jgi:hypothetical protein
MFAAGDTIKIEKSRHPNVVWLRSQYGIGPHKVKSVEGGYLRIAFANNEHLLWPSVVEKIAGIFDAAISLKSAYARNKDRDWCCRCGKPTIRIAIGAGFMFCPCTDPSWKGTWPT